MKRVVWHRMRSAIGASGAGEPERTGVHIGLRDAAQGTSRSIDNAIGVEVVQGGEWTGRCAEYCGLDHYRMNFIVAAVPPGEYEAWLDEQRSASEGQP